MGRDESRIGSPSDGELLAALAAMLDEDEPVPPDAVEAAIGVYTWHDVDGELFELLYDSRLEKEPEPVTRRPAAPGRMLTFSSPMLTLEINLTSGATWSMRGVLTPPDVYRIELHQADIVVVEQSSSAGLFEFTTTADDPLRLVVDSLSPDGRLVTPWIDLGV